MSTKHWVQVPITEEMKDQLDEIIRWQRAHASDPTLFDESSARSDAMSLGILQMQQGIAEFDAEARKSQL